MKVLVDYHHHALAESMMLLFHDRYEAEVYFPAGMEWFGSGIWQFEKHVYGDTFAKKYLVEKWADASQDNGIFTKADERYDGRVLKGISLEVARSIGIDMVISTLPHNDVGFSAFAREIGARFGVQVGNAGQQSRWDLASFALFSATVDGRNTPSEWGKQFVWNGIPCIIYHQEFDAKNTFYQDTDSAINSNIASSFVTRMPEGSDYSIFRSMAADNRDDFVWRAYGSYGAVGQDEYSGGDIVRSKEIANEMRKSRFGVHIKSVSDGFGHAIHNWAAVGRPIFWISHFYSGRLSEPLWEEGVNSWSIESISKDDLSKVMKRLRDDNDFWCEISHKTRKRFDEIVNFDYEADRIAEMLQIK